MITITVKKIEDFTSFLTSSRATNYLFYDIRQNENDASGHRVVNFHFLGVLGTLNILFQHAEELPTKLDVDAFVAKIKATIPVEGIAVVEGTIREIFLSLS
jgi:hypothetical protein